MSEGKTAINLFEGEHAFLSNTFPSPLLVRSVRYPTVLHAYSACRTEDQNARKTVASCATPEEADRLSRQFALRHGWHQRYDEQLEPLKIEVMRALLWAKFSLGSALAEQLLATGDATLIYGQPGEPYWGKVGSAGMNQLGRLLMDRRWSLAHLSQTEEQEHTPASGHPRSWMDAG